MANGSNLWLMLEVLTRRRNFIVAFVVIVTLIGLVISLVLPKYYRAEALLMPPKDNTMPISGLARLAEVASATKGLNLPIMVTTSDIYTRMLSSRSIMTVIAEEFDLQARYQTRNLDETLKAMEEYSTFRVTEEGLIQVSVEDRDPQFAADMANAFVDRLDSLNRRISDERARNNRLFIEDRLEQVEAQMDSARADFEAFQLTHKTVDFNQQTRLATDQAIQLKIRLAEADIELAIQREKLGEGHADLKELRRRREIIAGELARLETENADSSFFALPIAQVPHLRGEYEELYSRVKVSEALYQTLLTHREQARLQESENLSTVTVLDRARAPQVKSRPKRSVWVVGAFFLSLIVAILLAAFQQYLLRLQADNPDDHARAAGFLRAYLGWAPGMKRK